MFDLKAEEEEYYQVTPKGIIYLILCESDLLPLGCEFNLADTIGKRLYDYAQKITPDGETPIMVYEDGNWTFSSGTKE